MKEAKRKKTKNLRRNVRPTLLLLLIPIGVGLFTLSLVLSGLYYKVLAEIGNQHLVTPGWDGAAASMQAAQPNYERKFAYYKVKEGQTLSSIAAFFGVKLEELTRLNPGQIVTGVTIKIPPVEEPLQPTSGANGKISQAVVVNDNGLLRITQKYNLKQPVVTTIPELMKFLSSYQAIEQTGPLSYRLNKAISLQGDIRLDMTPTTIKKLEIKSTSGETLCLCMDESSALVKGVEVTTYDPATGQPDATYDDGRSFVRMKNGRLDVIDSHLHHLGTSLDLKGIDPKTRPTETEGGMYGMSWRISKESLGVEIATGWVEGSTFDHNHYGAYTFGASGMMWKGNLFADNDIYGLDPHDDSNNALIEDNIFYHNKKHGFIVSKRCNYNIIRNNISMDNAYHGFMLHENSAYNVIENNISYGNADNFVIYQSNFNTIANNKSYSPRLSHVRINQASANSFVTGNEFEGGVRGVYLYGGVSNVLIEKNSVHGVEKTLATNDANNVLFANNDIDRINYDIEPGDRLIYGENTIDARDAVIPTRAVVLGSTSFYKNGQIKLP